MIQLPSNDRPFTHHVVILSVLCGKGLFSYVAMVCFEQGYNTNVSRSMLSQKLHDMIRNKKSIYIREARGVFKNCRLIQFQSALESLFSCKHL